METVTEYKTSDMGLAASMMVEAIRYLRVQKDEVNPRKLIFVFESSPEIERISTERANGTHVVSSTDYDDALRKIKTIIHTNL